MPSKRFIAQQVLYRLAGGLPDTSYPIKEEDIIAALNQKINTLTKAQHFSITLPNGETIPDNLMLATYTGIAVTPVGSKSKCTLPVIPVSLPRNMGVFEIYPDSDGTIQFIPMQAGQIFLLSNQPIISDLLGQIGYEVRSSEVVFHRDITIDEINEVNMTLVIHDILQYDDYAPLPIPADWEGLLIDELEKDFAPVRQAPDKAIVDNYNPNPKGGNV